MIIIGIADAGSATNGKYSLSGLCISARREKESKICAGKRYIKQGA